MNYYNKSVYEKILLNNLLSKINDKIKELNQKNYILKKNILFLDMKLGRIGIFNFIFTGLWYLIIYFFYKYSVVLLNLFIYVVWYTAISFYLFFKPFFSKDLDLKDLSLKAKKLDNYSENFIVNNNRNKNKIYIKNREKNL